MTSRVGPLETIDHSQKMTKISEKLDEKKKQEKPHKHSAQDSESDDSDIEPDLVTTINQNSKSSFNAIKEILTQSGEPVTDSGGTFLQHYFQNITTSLPSRNAMISRRLSQCREEDEEEDRKDLKDQVPSNLATISGSDKSLSESSSGSKSSVIDTITGPNHKFVVTRTKPQPEVKEPSEAVKKAFANRRLYHQANTVHFPTGLNDKKPSIYSIFNRNPHYDSRFFDSSLIEMKSQTASASTIECDSVEDIWVKRVPNKKKVSNYDLFFDSVNTNANANNKNVNANANIKNVNANANNISFYLLC